MSSSETGKTAPEPSISFRSPYVVKLRELGKRVTARLEELRRNIQLPELVLGTHPKLAKAGLVQRAVNVGDKLPEITLSTPDGKTLSVNALVKTTPVVLIFFRGVWCPWCTELMRHLIEATDLFHGLGAEIIAVSPMTDAATKRMVEDKQLRFPAVGGASGRALIKRFGLGFNPLPDYDGLLEHLKVDIANLYGEDAVANGLEIPLPSAYVINTQGQFVYAFLEEDFRYRADLGEIAGAIVRAQRLREKYLTNLRPAAAVATHALQERRPSFFRRLFSRKGKSRAPPAAPNAEAKLGGERGLYRNPTFAGSTSTSFTGAKGIGAGVSAAFAYCLDHDEFRESFAAYLDETYCTENLLFYGEATIFANEFQAIENQKNEERAREVCETFVAPGAPLEVNIDDGTRNAAVERVKGKQIEPVVFEPAAVEVLHLMESDSFPKWRRTKSYAELWEKAGRNPELSPTSHLA